MRKHESDSTNVKTEAERTERRIFNLRHADRGRYLMIENAMLENPKLSFRAKGLLAYLLSRSPGWIVRVNHLATVSREKVECVQTALRELQREGYARLVTLHGKGGRLEGKEWIIFERPSFDPCKTGLRTDKAENRLSVKPSNGISATTNYGCTTNPGKENKRIQVTRGVTDILSDSDSATRLHRMPDTVADVVAFALRGCNPANARNILDAWRQFDGQPARDMVKRMEREGAWDEAEALQAAFRFLHWNNRSGWKLSAHWRTAFAGFLEKLNSDYPHVNGAADVPQDWIARIADERGESQRIGIVEGDEVPDDLDMKGQQP